MLRHYLIIHFINVDRSWFNVHLITMKVIPPKAKHFFRPPPRRFVDAGPVDLDPAVSWIGGDRLFSSKFNACYIDREKSVFIEQTSFLKACFLRRNWMETNYFAIGEIGFGTGLNFSIISNLWKRMAPAHVRLHYVAVERYPLNVDLISKFLRKFSNLETEFQELVNVYPPIHVGFNRVWLHSGKIVLTLIFGPIVEGLSEVEGQMDAWIMNDFSREKSPDMWSSEVFTLIGRLSKLGSRLKSVHSDSYILSELNRVGFEIAELNSNGSNRKILIGDLRKTVVEKQIPPWFRPPVVIGEKGTTGIIGAGIAGCAIARALISRGRNVILIDQRDKVAQEASGIPGALISPSIGSQANELSNFYDRAYRMVLASMNELGNNWRSRGVFKVLENHTVDRRIYSLSQRMNLWAGAALGLTRKEASDLIGIEISSSGIWFGDAGVVEPADYIAKKIDGVEFLANKMVGEILIDGDGWSINDISGNQILWVDNVVVAASQNSICFGVTKHLPLTGVMGQLSILPETPSSSRLSAAVLGGSYLIPASSGTHIIGSTHIRGSFDNSIWPLPVTSEDHAKNFKGLVPEIQCLFSDADKSGWSGYAGVRATTSDRLPIVGPVAEPESFRTDFSRLRHGPKGQFPKLPVYQPGLYIIAGLGSRGFLTADVSAEILACQMLGEPWPVERNIALSLSPSRFLFRQLRADK